MYQQPPRPAYAPGMEHSSTAPRKSWLRRHRFRVAFSVLALALAAAGVLRAWPSGPGGGDYRDPVQLAQAVKNSEAAKTGTAPVSASCAKNTFTGKYMCFVFYTGGTSAAYTVTVSADGKSYQAS
jgi:hypothetical protein